MLLAIWLIFQALTVVCLAAVDCKSEDMCNKIMWIPTPIRWVVFTVPSIIRWANK